MEAGLLTLPIILCLSDVLNEMNALIAIINLHVHKEVPTNTKHT